MAILAVARRQVDERESHWAVRSIHHQTMDVRPFVADQSYAPSLAFQQLRFTRIVASQRITFNLAHAYSHSIVPGGLDVCRRSPG